MTHSNTASWAALALSATLTAQAQTADWPYPEDIPTIAPVSVGLAGKRPADIVRYLMANGAIQSEISPDGRQIAYSSRITGEPQLWLVNAGGGWPKQLTFGSGISFFKWRPGGKQLIVGRDLEGNERDGFFLLSLDGTEEHQLLAQGNAYRSFGMFSPDGTQIMYASTERNGTDFDIYRYDIDANKQTLVYQGRFGFFPAAWQPDGELVIVDETRGEDGNDVHLLNVRSGELTALFQPAVSASYADYAWLPDGTGFYLATNQDREFSGLAFYSLKSKSLTYLETPDADVSNVTLSDNARYLAWTTNEDGYSMLHVFDRDKDRHLNTPDLPAGVYAMAFSTQASSLMIDISGPAMPGDVVVWDVRKNRLSRAVRSSLAGLKASAFVTPISLRYPTRDGVMLQGLLYLPKDSEKDASTPVVVNVHGGPTAQARPGFKPQVQYLVNTGIAVFDVNVRGSTGFGKTYARLDNQDKRLDSVRDLVDTVAFLKTKERLKESRFAVMGGSYGGYMVNAVLGSYPDVFDAGISMVGVSDWVRALQEASPALKASDRIEYGDISEERWQTFYRENSPINNAQNIRVPLLVQHGANDPRDPVTESDRIVQTIREADGSVEYLRFPDEGHRLSKQPNRVAFYRAMARFLDTHLKVHGEGQRISSPR